MTRRSRIRKYPDAKLLVVQAADAISRGVSIGGSKLERAGQVGQVSALFQERAGAEQPFPTCDQM